MIGPGGTPDLSRFVQMVAEGWGAFFSIVAVIVIWQTRWADEKKTARLIRFIIIDAILLISDVLAIAFRGRTGAEAFYIVRIANAMVFVMGYMLIMSGVTYFSSLIEDRVSVSVKNWRLLEYFIGLIGVIMIIINVFYPYLYDFDKNNRYYRLPGNKLVTFTYVLGVLLILVLLLNFSKNLKKLEKFAVCSALIFPMLSLVFQSFNYGISLVILATCISVMLTFGSHMMDYTAMIAERERERESKMADLRIRILHDQIKPHFIYNALTGIYYGMDESIPRSKKALKNLAGYLRGSLDVLDERDTVEFQKELDTVRCYLEVEAFRFDDQVEFEVDAEDTDFSLPAFSLQTLVENSVRHGIRKKDPPSGRVRIHSWLENDVHRVEIADNGIGFDVGEAMDKEGVHIGLVNTKKRIELMCGGSMDIESKPGEGTRITLNIPAEEI